MRPLTPLELTACDREPIHAPGSIQPHGALLALDTAGGVVRQASANASTLLRLSRPPQGARLAELLHPSAAVALEAALSAWAAEPSQTLIHTLSGAPPLFVAAHAAGDRLVLELEPDEGGHGLIPADLPALRRFVDALPAAGSIAALCAEAARQARAITGLDRVLVYRFDRDFNGTVVAEDGNGRLPSYMDLRFPASDIPAQARALYRVNRTRYIPDVDYVPVPIEPALDPATGHPLDLSRSTLRAVPPVHLQYMRNMGTPFSMSFSIVVEGALWGLLSCHAVRPTQIAPSHRQACEFLAMVLALQIGARQHVDTAAQRIALKGMEGRLLAAMSREASFAAGLAYEPRSLLGLTRASGAAVLADGELTTVGHTPDAEAIRAIAAWLEARGTPEIEVTECLGAAMPGGSDLAATASGLIAVSVPRLRPSFVLWFRPEVVQTVTWGGDPRKEQAAMAALDADADADGETTPTQLGPRASFEAWREQVRGHALPWSYAEVGAARDLRAATIEIVLRQAEERAALADELQRTNEELESFSYSISHDLRAPFRHIAGYAELLARREGELDDKSTHYLDSIRQAAVAAGRLVDDLLEFSRTGRKALARSRIDMRKLFIDVRRSLEGEMAGRRIEWEIGDLPPAWGDPALLHQVVLNLLSNAVKYTRTRDPARIAIAARTGPDADTYSVRDNGVGFEMAYVAKLFGVFQRLHRAEEFEGTGIGLAIARRIVERHGGEIWAESVVGEGAAFYFTLPHANGAAVDG